MHSRLEVPLKCTKKQGSRVVFLVTVNKLLESANNWSYKTHIFLGLVYINFTNKKDLRIKCEEDLILKKLVSIKSVTYRILRNFIFIKKIYGREYYRFKHSYQICYLQKLVFVKHFILILLNQMASLNNRIMLCLSLIHI